MEFEKDKRQGTMLRGIIESNEQSDKIQEEFWIQISRRSLGLPFLPENKLYIKSFDMMIDATESQWVVNFEGDKDAYGYYIYFIRLGNKQASLAVDRRGWVKTPIFLRAAANQGLYLDVENVPKEVITQLHVSGYKFTTTPERSERCNTCSHYVNDRRDVVCNTSVCNFAEVKNDGTN